MTRLTPAAIEAWKNLAQKMGMVYAGEGSLSLIVNAVGRRLGDGETVVLSVEDEAPTS